MSAPKHNPGPWHVSMVGGREPQVWAGRELCVAKVNTSLPAHEANAALLAAAPEMLGALRAALADAFGPREYRVTPVTCEAIRAAIAKAEGRG